MIKKRNKSGFTLIELLVVIAIIGILSSVVIQSLSSSRIKSHNTTRLTQIDQINKAFELGATGGTNQLPFSNGIFACLGASFTGADCSTADTQNDTLSTNLAKNLSGGIIKRDPVFTSGIGFMYQYHSSLSPTTENGCTAGSCPTGAYLLWVVKDSTNCGRGKHWQTVTNGSQCVLRIGDAVTS